MLRPSYLENLPAPMVSLIDELQNEIIDDLVKRIVKGKYNTPSSEWMIYKANQLRLSSAEVNKIIAKNAKVRERLVKELYTDAVKEALTTDAEIYRYAINNGALPQSSTAALKSYFRDIALNNTFRAGLSATNGLMRNLTGSMAATANRMLSDALDLAWLEVASGAFTPDEACFKAVQNLTANGLKVVNYASGHKDQVDVAVSRAIRTGINKTCGEMQIELAGDVGSDLVEVSSHFGARPSHAEWQGQIYSLSGKNPKYRDFRSSTGYGSGDGLCGWNCRHSFFPYFEGLSLPASVSNFTAEENLEMYENQQKQRAYERAVRRSKRDLAGLDAARQSTTDPQLKEKLDREFARKSVTLKRREERLSQFCKDKGLMPDNSRVRVAGFGRSEAQKAVWANKKETAKQNPIEVLTSDSFGGTIKEVITKISDTVKEIIHDMPQRIPYSELPAEYRSNFERGLAGSHDIVKKVVEEVRDNVNYVISDELRSYYRNFGDYVKINLEKPPSTMAHELFHKYDAENKITQNGIFNKALDRDFAALKKVSNGDIKQYLFDKYPDAFTINVITNVITIKPKYRGISDIISGITNDDINLGFHHKKAYWEVDPNRKIKEAFAQTGRIYYDNDPDVIAMFNELFPSFSHNVLVKLLK